MKWKHIRLKRLAWSSLAAASVALPAHGAQAAPEAPADTDGTPVARVVVSAAAPLEALDRGAPTASRLDLSVRETPATVDVITAETMEIRGYQSVEQAVDSLPGVSSGGAPGSPSQFSMRGFTGDQVTVLRDGIYLGPADMTYRPQNTFNLASVEVLKGPGSVLYGQGAIAGTVNVISKKASLGANSLDGVASYGRFNSSQMGVGANKVLAPGLALRADVSRTASSGFVDRAHADSTNATLSLLWKPNARFDLALGLDYLTDHPSSYYGTPLVSAAFAGPYASGVVATPDGSTIDRRLRDVNYNVGDYRIESTQYLPRIGLHWRPSDGITISNDAYYLYADRKWKNAETYAFDPGTNRVDRDRFFVFHEQHLAGDQLSATFAQPLAGLANRFVIGLDYSKLDFVRTRGFPDGDSVAPFQPAAGVFGPLVGRRSPTRWHDRAVFLEDALDLTDRLKLVGGARAERFDLVRENYGPDGSYQAATSFERTFRPKNWRLGLVYQDVHGWAPYIQYSTGQDPVGSNILLVNAGQNFDLSRSRQVEAGVKTDLDGRRGELTLAVYDIERRNLLTQTSADVVDTAGMQKSRGLELTLGYKPLPAWKVDANLAYTDASYRNFIDTSNGVDASGNRPANVPRWSANLWNRYSGFGGIPLEVGAGLRYVGERYGNTANTMVLKSYTLIDLYANYRLGSKLSLIARVNNAANRFYAQWADVNYPTQIQLGAPIGYELGLVAHF
ncbi:TonB-dependent siderophore receptor [Massilia sp. 9096]|uniref:TonB-dependent receptor n=1 Tax=Massilia sp. 9096 TaxID=1500894 RepID=UPI00068E148C|nr:TonB-dependent receptor [Massilia sp. 9096]